MNQIGTVETRYLDLPGPLRLDCSREIGPIRIAEFYSVVGVPDDQVDHVVRSLVGALIRNKPASARRFVEK